MRLIDEVAGWLYGPAIKDELQYRSVYKYLDRYEKKDKRKEPLKRLNDEVKLNKTIWICWFQGMEAAPKLVKKCYESVRKNKPESFELIVITYENLNDYIDIPEYVMKKHIKGSISRAHLSDIIRTELLYTYGGCWIDATVYCSDKIPEYMLSGELFVFKWSLMDASTLSISNWWIYARKEQGIISDVRDMLYRYWENESEVKNYFLYHIIFSKVVKGRADNRKEFNNVPYCNNSVPHALYCKMPSEFQIKEWDIIKSNSCIHKLSYKEKYLQGDIYNYYTALLEGKLV